MSKTTWKTIGYVALALVMVVCLLVDGLWVYVKYFAEDITVVNTFNFDEITTVAASEEDVTSAHVIEVKYYTNDNNNGLEAIEIQFNQFSDETQALIYSYGIQLVIDEDSTEEPFVFDDYQALSTGHGDYDYQINKYYGLWRNEYYYSMFCSMLASNGTYSFYESDDQFETFTVSSSSDFSDEGFLITLANDDNLYRMNFQGQVYENEDDHTSSDNYLYRSLYNVNLYPFVTNYFYTNYYSSYDIYYFVSWIYSKVSSSSVGTDSAHWFYLGQNMFSFEVYDSSTGQYTPVGSDALADKVDTFNITYGGIYVTKVADGLSTASQSMFNAVNGSAQYDNGLGDTDGDGESDPVEEYYYGKSVVTCDVYDFDYTCIAGNYYVATLSQDFLDTYLPSTNSIALSVQLDLDVLEKNNITFYGFSSDSGLDNFTIYECYTYTIVNDEKVITEVNYV